MTDHNQSIQAAAFAALRRNGFINDRDAVALFDTSSIRADHRGRIMVPPDFVSSAKAAKPTLFPGAELDARTLSPAAYKDALRDIGKPARRVTSPPAGVFNARTAPPQEYAAALKAVTRPNRI